MVVLNRFRNNSLKCISTDNITIVILSCIASRTYVCLTFFLYRFNHILFSTVLLKNVS